MLVFIVVRRRAFVNIIFIIDVSFAPPHPCKCVKKIDSRGIVLDFCEMFQIEFFVMSRKNLRSPLQNNSPGCFVRCVRFPFYIGPPKNKAAPRGWEWFNPVRNEDRFKEYIERAKKMANK